MPVEDAIPCILVVLDPCSFCRAGLESKKIILSKYTVVKIRKKKEIRKDRDRKECRMGHTIVFLNLHCQKCIVKFFKLKIFLN